MTASFPNVSRPWEKGAVRDTTTPLSPDAPLIRHGDLEGRPLEDQTKVKASMVMSGPYFL